MKAGVRFGLVLWAWAALAVSGRAAELVIEGFSGDGELSWSDVQGDGTYTIEWSPSLSQTNWSSDWSQLSSIPATGGDMSVRVPMFFRIRHSPAAAVMVRGPELSAPRDNVPPAPMSASGVASSGQSAAGRAFSGAGSGSKEDPYRVATPAQLQEIDNWPSSHFVLACDLDISGTAAWDDGKGFRPIGGDAQPFAGVFDGRGHRITGLRIARFGVVTRFIALFGATTEQAWIGNVRVQDAVVAGCDHVGILVGGNEGTITNCHVAGVVSGSGSFGGLVGSNNGRVAHCSSAVGVRPLWVGNHLGGLVGANSGTIQDCFAVGAVTGNENAGGLVGINYGVIERCYARTEVQSSFAGSSDTYRRAAGGLVGANEGEGAVIRDSFAGGAVTGPDGLPVGLLAGGTGDQAAIHNCYALTVGESSIGGVGLVYPDAARVECATVPEAGAALFGLSASPLGNWDFARTWRAETPGKPSRYPRLTETP